MAKVVYYEVEGAVFRDTPESGGRRMEIYSDHAHAWKPYAGESIRVRTKSNPMTLEEVQPYMASA